MARFRLTSIRPAMGQDVTIINFDELVGLQRKRILSIRVGPNGRLRSVGYNGTEMMWSRDQRKAGGKSMGRMPTERMRRIKDMAATAMAYKALTGSVTGFPLQDVNL